MSDGPDLAGILVSQLGAPRDHAAEWLGAGLVLLALVVWLGLELGLAKLLARAGRAATSRIRERKDHPQRPLTPPPSDP